jgi:hypothetical protein
MPRLITCLCVMLITFGLGLLAWFANPFRGTTDQLRGPLRVTISPEKHQPDTTASFEYYAVTISNVSTEPVRGYSLGFTCNCYEPITYTYPNPKGQLLQPGESQIWPAAVDVLPVNGAERMIWVDLAHFKSGFNWGPNKGHTESYLRE